MRSPIVKAVASAVVLSSATVTVTPFDPPVAEATSSPDLTAELAEAATKLVETSLLPELNELVPGLATNPAQLFELHHPFLQLATLDPNADLETAIVALSSDGFTFGNVVVTEGDTTTLTFDLSIDRDVSVELGFIEDDIQLLGGAINVDVTMPATTITAEYDPSAAAGDEFALVDLPRLDITMSITEPLDEQLQFGYASATAGGTFALNSTISLQFSDPDSSGRLTLPEMTTAAIEDLLAVSFDNDTASPELDADIALTADVSGIAFTGTVTLTDDHLFEGDPVVSAIDLVGPNPIELLTNIGPDTVLNGLNQVLSGFGAGVIAGDPQLPFLDGGVLIPQGIGEDEDYDQILEIVAPLYEYVRARSTQLNCGAFPAGTAEPDHTAPVPAYPAGDLEDGQFVACRAFAGEDPKPSTSVSWTPTGATLLTTDAAAIRTSVGIDPATSVIFEMDGAGDFDTTLTFTPSFDPSAVTVEQRPATIQQLIGELETEGALPTGAVSWDPDLQALMFDLSFTSDAVTRSTGVDAGNGFAAQTHLTGLTAEGAVDVEIGPVAADLKIGMILVEDAATIASDTPPPPESEAINNTESRRFVIEVPASGDVLTIDDVAIDATAGFSGRLGFLEVAGSAALSTSKPVATDPALAIEITDPTGVTVGSGPSVPDAMIIGDLLADPLSHVGATANLTVEAVGDQPDERGVTVSANALAATGSAGFDFTWPLDGAPSISNFTTEFDTLVQFDTSDTLNVTAATTAATGDALTPGRPVDVAVTVSQTDLLTRAGLVGAILVRSGQPDCQITSVDSASGLTCSLAVPATFNPAQVLEAGEYDLVGNTLTHLAAILAAIEQFATLLEDAVVTAGVGDDFELWGVSPRDIATQAQELRAMVDEFRGVAAATVTCSPTPAPGDPPDPTIKGLPVGMASPNIACHAANSNTNSSNVRWRAVQVSTGSSAWVNAAGNTVGQGSATVDLTVPDSADANSDGFIALGTEYTVVVEWTDGQGDHRASLPPPVPGSLTRLEKLVESTLGLPDAALAFRLDPGPTLAIELGYGICSSPAPAGLAGDCTGLPAEPAVDLDVAIDLGDQTLAGLSTQGNATLNFAALGQFNIGVPLDGSTPEVLAGTGLNLTAAVISDDFGLEGNLGPFGVQVGAAVAITGIAQVDSAQDVLVVTPAVAPRIPLGATVVRTSDNASCDVSGVLGPDGNGNIPLTCTGVEWAEGDNFSVTGASALKGQLGLDVDVTPGSIDPNDPGNIGVNFDITGLDDDCGALPSGDTVIGTNPPPAGDTLACARLALGLTAGSTTKYLGDFGFDLVNADPGPFDPEPTVVVPSNLASELAAALLDPSFLLQALPKLLEDIEQALRDAANGLPAAAGDPLRTAADGLAAVRSVLGDALTLAGDLSTPANIESALQTTLDELLAPYLADGFSLDVVVTCTSDPCGSSPAEIEDISVEVDFGAEINADTDINLGLEGLPLSVSAGIEAGANWSLNATIGLSRQDGPYLADVGASVGAFVNVGGGTTECLGILPLTVDDTEYDTEECLQARLGFLELEAMDSIANPTGVDATASLNITDNGNADGTLTFAELIGGQIGVTGSVSGGINIDVAFRTGIAGTGADLPSILGTLQLSADIVNGTPSTTFDLGNLHLDVGTYLTTFLGPVIEEINDIIKPFLPIVDTLTAPIPVVSDLAALVGQPPVTMLSLLEVATGANLDLLESILEIVDFVGELGEIIADLEPGESLQMGLGNPFDGLAASATAFSNRDPGAFSVNTAAANAPVSPDQAGALIGNVTSGGSGFVNDIAGGTPLDEAGSTNGGRPTTFGVPGLSFPFLDDASQIFGLLVGRDAVLIRWDAGTMEASAGLSWDFGPIAVGPVPITISIGGDIGIRGRFAIGYDTVGIRQLIDGGSGFDLLNGIFIDDLDAQGNDVAEVEFFGRVWAGASVDLVIVSAGVKGGIELTFGLNLNDSPDPDGKLRIQEIIDKLANPICLFDVEGKIEAFLAVFVKIDLFFFTEEYTFELVRITLLEWSESCEPPPPDLATASGGVLYLNVGSRAGFRNVAEDEENEKLEVRQIGPGTVRVSGYGIEEVEKNISLIVADAGHGNDELLFLPGGDENAEIPFTIPVAASGGPGNDVIKMAGETGGATDLVYGDAAVGVTEWAGVAFTPVATQPALEDESFDDFIEPGAGDDAVLGNQGDDRISGGLGVDSVQGGTEVDRVTGGPGNDLIRGNSGDDTLSGGPTQVGATNDDDVIVGDTGMDTVTGDIGNDKLFGDTGLLSGSPVLTYAGDGSDWADACTASGQADIMVGDIGNDVLIGGGGDDQITGGDGIDTARGCDGNDLINGDADGDFLFGDADDDTLNGGTGADTIRGGANEDLARGEAGTDVIFGDTGADLLLGDDGDDIVVGDTGSVSGTPVFGVADGSGSAVDQTKADAVATAVDHSHGGTGARRADCVENRDLTGDSDCVIGGTGSDALFGTGAGDHIRGDAGPDLLVGDAGNDLMRGGTDGDALFGSAGDDEMYGESSRDEMFGDRTVAEWLTDTPSGGGADDMFGGATGDRMEGDGGTDDMFGGADNDHMEGNGDDDNVHGESNDDDIIGGSDAPGLDDAGDTLLSGGTGIDWIAGDNATMTRAIPGGPDYPSLSVDPIVLYDLAATGGGPVAATAFGGDTMSGGGAEDYMFGQGGDDTISGGDAPDYVEGNDGDDTITGDGGDDDLVGGGSAADGVIDKARIGTTLHDGGETLISGGDGIDWIAGDNAIMNRVLFDDVVEPVTLFDVNSGDTAVSGGDTVHGDGDSDRIWGQGNGAQDSAQSDPADGADNDGDGAVDEDGGGWAGDVLFGNGDRDEIEGNHGSDFVSGGEGPDDIAGGGSAIDGVIDADRLGDGLLDARDTIHGDAGADVAGGDNVRILPAADGVFWLADARDVLLFDVNSANATLSGGDYVAGGTEDDVVFGQGNGAQPGQADPLDGYDNDLDGRESGASTVYDCEDAADNDGTADVDAADPDCLAAIDEDQPWFGDILIGNDGHDVIEGNHGADLIYGDADQDILLGGGSAIDGHIVAGRESAGLLDGPDVIRGGGDHDVITGDNAVVDPVKNQSEWAFIPGAADGDPFDLLAREIGMTTVPDAAGNFGDDHLLGGDDHDQLFGQQGHDLIEAEAGDDAVVGDLGTIVSQVEDGSSYRHIAPRQPFFEDDIFGAGTLTHRTTLFSQVTGNGAEGDDVILGGQGHDDLHGGPGADFVNGDRFAPPAPPDPDLIELIPGQFIFDDNQVEPYENEDAIFGGYGDDVVWGGRGPDQIYGGWGEDHLDVRPRPASENGPADPPTWFTWAGTGAEEEHYQDSDFVYGGWEADILQANFSEPGPHDGDRLLDWVGAYNSYFVCPGAYGDWTITRLLAPGLDDYLEDLADGDGLVDVRTPGSSGYLELGLVYRKDAKNNANPPHDQNPAHFYCGDGTG